MTILNEHQNQVFLAQKIFNNDLVVIHKIKTLNKPAYVGKCILELSKYVK